MLTSYLEVSERNDEKQYILGKCFPACILMLATALGEIRYTWLLWISRGREAGERNQAENMQSSHIH